MTESLARHQEVLDLRIQVVLVAERLEAAARCCDVNLTRDQRMECQRLAASLDNVAATLWKLAHDRCPLPRTFTDSLAWLEANPPNQEQALPS